MTRRALIGCCTVLVLCVGLWLTLRTSGTRSSDRPTPTDAPSADESVGGVAIDAHQRTASVASEDRSQQGSAGTAAAEPTPPTNAGVPVSDAELAGFVRGYIEPNKAAAVRDAGQTYERLLREVAPDLRPELTAHHHELAWQVAFAWRDEEITKLDALRELVANHQVSAAPPSRKADASVITTGQLSWQPPADDPGAAAVNLRYQIRESDHPPYTAAWRQRGVAQRAWLDSLTELREAKK